MGKKNDLTTAEIRSFFEVALFECDHIRSMTVEQAEKKLKR